MALLVDFYMAKVISKSEQASKDTLERIEMCLSKAIACPLCSADWTTGGASELDDKTHTVTIWCEDCQCSFQYDTKFLD
jgi:transcription elongation factor Elf1